MSNDDPTKKLPDESQRLVDPMEALLHDVSNLSKQIRALDEKVDARLHDTRPIWQAVQIRLEAVEAELKGIRSEMDKGFRNVEHRLDVVSVDINRVRADIHDHESRINTVEENLKSPSSRPQG